METQVSKNSNYWMKEFTYFDGEFDITFNILDVDTDKMIIKLAITKASKIYTTEYDLQFDENYCLYFLYGVEKAKIKLNRFRTIRD